MKLYSIQIARGIACLSVCVYHLFGLSRDYAGGVFYDPLVFAFSSGVDLFFVISGLVMVITTSRKFDDPGTPTRFAIHRLTRIYPAYWVLASLLTVYWLYNPSGINAKNGGVDIVSSFTLAPSKLLPIVPVAWSLSFELMFYFVFWLMLIFVARRRLPLALLGWALVVGLGSPLAYLACRDVFILNFVTNPLVLEFIAGAFIGLAYLSNRMPSPSKALVLGVTGYVVLLISAHLGHLPEGVASWHRLVWFGPPAIFITYGLIGLELTHRLKVAPKILIRVGDFSYSLYLVHILVFHAAYRIIFHRLYEGFHLTFLVGTFCAAIMLGYAYYRLVELPIGVATRRWLERMLRLPVSVSGVSTP